MKKKLRPVVQQEKTGCGIASVAVLAGLTYPQARKLAGSLGIHADDRKLWSRTDYVRTMLRKLGIRADAKETPFRSWGTLPDCALLAIKWHRENGVPFWHWAVFVREDGQGRVLDSSLRVKQHVRIDFGRIKPKWFIGVR
jgi:ABC-type bacteriocin/lantibiotic exporter with double-glycine peptidase domain